MFPVVWSTRSIRLLPPEAVPPRLRKAEPLYVALLAFSATKFFVLSLKIRPGELARLPPSLNTPWVSVQPEQPPLPPDPFDAFVTRPSAPIVAFKV